MAEVDSEAAAGVDELEGVASAAGPVRAGALVVVLARVAAVSRVPVPRHAHQLAALLPTVVRRYVRRLRVLAGDRDPALAEEESVRGIALRCSREVDLTLARELARSGRAPGNCRHPAQGRELAQELVSAVGQVERLEFQTSRLAGGQERTCPVPARDFRIAAERVKRLGVAPRNQRLVCLV